MPIKQAEWMNQLEIGKFRFVNRLSALDWIFKVLAAASINGMIDYWSSGIEDGSEGTIDCFTIYGIDYQHVFLLLSREGMAEQGGMGEYRDK